MSRKRYIQIRVSEDELEQIKSRAGDISLSTFLRQIALEQPVIQPEPKTKNIVHSVDPELIREVARIGININQITRHLNITEEVDRQIFLDVMHIKNELDELLERVLKNAT